MEPAVDGDSRDAADSAARQDGIEELADVGVFHIDFGRASRAKESASAHASGSEIRSQEAVSIKQEPKMIGFCSEDSTHDVARMSPESRRRRKEVSTEDGSERLPAKVLRAAPISRHIARPPSRHSSSHVRQSSTPQPGSPPHANPFASTSSNCLQRLPTPSSPRASSTHSRRLPSPLGFSSLLPPPATTPLPPRPSTPTPVPSPASHPFLPSLSAFLRHLSPSISSHGLLLLASGSPRPASSTRRPCSRSPRGVRRGA